MARIAKPLTSTEVKQAKAKQKVYALSDGEGLQLRVNPNGTKLWLFDYYRPLTKVRTCLSFGSYPEVSIADARNIGTINTNNTPPTPAGYKCSGATMGNQNAFKMASQPSILSSRKL